MKKISIILPYPIYDPVNTPRGVIGGSQTRAIQMRDGFLNEGFDVELLSLGCSMGFNNNFGSYKSIEGMIEGYNRMKEYLIENPPDSLCLMLTKSALPWSQLNLLTSFKNECLLTVFTLITDYGFQKFSTEVGSLNMVDSIVTQQEYAMRNLVESGVDERLINIIPNPIDLSQFKPPSAFEKIVLRKRFDIREDSVVVLSTSRLIEKKGVRQKIDLIKRCERDGLRVTFLFVGADDKDGEGREFIDEIATLERSVKYCKVLYLGKVKYGNMPNIYKMADLFLQNSNEEGFSNSLLEALASGLAIISTNIPENRILARDGVNALTYSFFDVENMLGNLQKYLSTPEMVEQYGKNSRGISDGFGKRKVIKRYLDVIFPLRICEIVEKRSQCNRPIDGASLA